MTVEKLYYLVHSLTRDQKSNFTRYTRGGKKGLDIVLYERILAQKELTAKAAETIRGKEFKVASKYYLYRVKLAERIIQSLVSFESAKVSALSYIHRAVTMDAVELAEKTLADEMIKAQEREDFATLRYLYDFSSELQQDYNFKFTYHKDLRSREEVKYLTDTQHTLEDLLVQIRQYFPKTGEDRRIGASFLSSRLAEIEPETHKARYTFEKVRVGLALLAIENDKSLDQQQQPFDLQKGLVNQMLTRKDLFSTTRMCRELSILIRLAEFVGDRDAALHYTLTYSRLDPRTLIEEKEFSKDRIVKTIDVGELWANLTLAEKGIQELEECRFQFDNRQLVHAYLKLGLNFFYNEQFSNALSCFQKVRSIPGKDWGRVSWEPDTLLLLCHLELGNLDVIDSLARSAYRNTKKYESEYPKTVVRIIQQVVRAGTLAAREVYPKGLNEIRRTWDPGEEVHESPFFDFSIWLEAKIEGVSQADLFASMGKVKYQRKAERRLGT